jgi:hypothetical protein
VNPARQDVVQQDMLIPATEPQMPDNNGTVASASTLDLTQVTSSFIEVTGTTTITVIVIPEGQTRTLRFTGTLSLVHGTELVLPDLLDIKTLDGDYAEFRGYSGGVVRCVNYATAKTNTNADLASAATLDLTTIAANVVNVTGTTTVTAITLREGITKTLRFTGSLTLTNGASLILPGAANIVTAAEDFAEVRGYASGVVRCTAYTANVTTAGGVAAATHAATSKTTPVDADELPLVDSADSNILKKLTWTNLKATLKTYFDSVTTTLTNKTLTAPVINGSITTTGLTLPAITLSGAVTGGSQNVSGLGTVGCGAITSTGRFTNTANTVHCFLNDSPIAWTSDGTSSGTGRARLYGSSSDTIIFGLGSSYAAGMTLSATSLSIGTSAFTAGTVKAANAAGFISSDGSTGYTGTVTTASLVGKTITIKDGIITNFA